MRHEMTSIIALHSMVALALLTIVPVSISEQGILAVPSFLGTAPTPDAIFSDGGVLTAGFYSITFAVAGVLGTLATALFRQERGTFPIRISGRGRAR